MFKLSFLLALFVCVTSAFGQLRLNADFTGGVTDGQANSYVSAVQSDGKILVGGKFDRANGVAQGRLARLHPDGSLDTTFNPGGAGPNRHVYEIKVLADGKILIGGAFTSYNSSIIRGVARLNSDGTLDTSFNAGGIGTAGNVHSVTVQPDGKYLLSGEFLSSYNGVTKFSIIRIHPNGTLDTSFTSPFTSAVFVEQTAVQADGGIVAGGQFSIEGRQNVVRLNTNGTLDSSFTPTLTNGGVYAVFVDPENRIFVGGDFRNFNGVSRPGLARLQPNGALDTTFVPVFPQSDTDPYVEYLAFRSDGKIVIAAGFYEQGRIVSVRQFNPDGTPDSSFIPPRFSDGGYHVALQPDGRILLTGYFDDVETPRTGHQNVIRLNPNGTLDNTFNGGVGTHGGVAAVLEQADGKYVVAGDFYRANSSPHRSVVRFNADGSVDESFQSGWGLYETVSPSSFFANPNNPSYLSLVQQVDGKLIFWDTTSLITSYDLVGGYASRRLNQDGSPDPTFVLPGSFANGSINDVLVQPDGKILMGGSRLGTIASPPVFSYRMLVRLNPDLTLDSTFTHGTTTSSSSSVFVRKMLRQPDGKLIVIGTFSNYLGSNRAGAVRLNENGTIDTTFTATGGNYRAVALQSDGKIAVAGNSFIRRWNSDGTVDSTFNPGSGPNGLVTSIVVQPDNKIVIGGTFTGYNGMSVNKLARLNTDGSLDTTYPSGLDGNPNNIITSAIPTSDGHILMGGLFSNYGGIARSNLAKLDIENPPTPSPTPTPLPTPTGTPSPVPSPSPCTGALAFENAPEVGAGASPQSVAVGDFNGDGRQDLATANLGSHNVSVRLGLGDGTFVAAPDLIVGNGPRQVVISDINRDGKQDVAVVNSGSGNVSIRLGLGDGRFASTADVDVGISLRGIAVGDLNGDGKPDLAVTDASPVVSSNVKIRLGVGNGTFTAAPDVSVAPSATFIETGDVNGDGKLDLAVIHNDFSSIVSIRLGVGDGTFTTAPNVNVGPFARSLDIGDLNSDGKRDLVVSSQLPNDYLSTIVSVRLGNGDGTFTVAPDVIPGQLPIFVRIKDLDVDGKPDILVANTTSGTVSVRLGVGDGTFIADSDVFAGDGPSSLSVGDYNGDGRHDLAVVNAGSNSIAIRLGTCGGPTSRAQFDYDGDGRTDFSVFRPSSGAWYLQRSTAGFQGLQFGADGDRLTPADYDGDGKTDISIYRPSTGIWYILNSATNTVTYPVFGVAEDLPAPGDYDGDGKADLNVFRPSQGTWYRQNSSNGTFFGFQFGANGDVPTVGDFDGDGKNDLGIWRPSNGDWYNIRSSNGSVFGERFGQTGDKIAPADYDGDGKTDIAIYRPSTGLWVVRNSATATYSYFVFGSPSDIPISGDYDGDGKADIGVWRPSDGTWYIQRSSNSQFIVFPWGQDGDRPTPAAFGN
jgi:uncharacterized delta-60 repeat protein